MAFDYALDFDKTDFRKNPQLYKVGVGEQGVLLVQPYKSEILPYWRFKTPEIAEKSAIKIYKLFLEYLNQSDFVGADMARKFLQMGFTRARRYANHPSGQKYTKASSLGDQKTLLETIKNLKYPYSSGSSNKNNAVIEQSKGWQNSPKALSAEIFKKYWFLAKDNSDYKRQKLDHQQKYGK